MSSVVQPIKFYYPGTLVRCFAAFTDLTGAFVDPTTVAGTWAFKPSGGNFGAPNTGSVVKDSVGNYHFDVDTTSNGAGTYAYKFVGTGANQAANDDEFIVRAALF